MELYRIGCASGDPVLKRFPNAKAALADPTAKREFYEKAHSGFTLVQDKIVSRLLELEKTPDPPSEYLPEELVLRKLADAIAWQIFGSELYIARRLFGGQKPQRLSASNYLSVLMAAKHLVGPNLQKFALLSDLTTFVQIGDLVIVDAENGGIQFVEVKEGRKNHEYLEALTFLAESKCDHFLKHFYDKEGAKGIDQLKRMTRQATRMNNLGSILKDGIGEEPFKPGATVRIPEEPIDTEWVDSAISELIEKSKDKGWAIQVIDDCMFIGAYRGMMFPVAEKIFRAWFNMESGGRSFPVINLNQCMTHPLALPIFNRHFREEAKADLLFGRCKIMIGIQLDGFITLLNKHGLTARWGTRKETAKANRDGNALMIDNKAIILDHSGSLGCVGDGVVVRMAYHGISPDTVARAVGLMHKNIPPNKSIAESESSIERC